jgi:hypothetical protein
VAYCRERTIAIYRSSDTYVVQARSWLPDAVGGVVWFGPGPAHGTVYIPVLAGMQHAPDTLGYGWQGVYNTSTAFWANRRVLNYAQVKFSYMIEDIRRVQNACESASVQLVDALTQQFMSPHQQVTGQAMAAIERLFEANAWKATYEMNQLLHSLFFTYPDGYLDYWDDAGFHSTSLGYPVWWMEAGNYKDGPPDVSAASVLQQRFRDTARSAQAVAEKRAAHAVRPGARAVPGVALAGAQDMPAELASSSLLQCLRSCDSVAADAQYRICAQGCTMHMAGVFG